MNFRFPYANISFIRMSTSPLHNLYAAVASAPHPRIGAPGGSLERILHRVANRLYGAVTGNYGGEFLFAEAGRPPGVAECIGRTEHRCAGPRGLAHSTIHVWVHRRAVSFFSRP